jgi:polysaccharide biosynthesis transport protein
MLDSRTNEPASSRAEERQEDELASVSLADIAKFLVRNLRIIATSIMLALAMATFLLILATPAFTAKAQVLIDARPPQFLRDQLGDASLSLDSAQVESQIAVLRSEQVAMIVIQRLNLLTGSQLLSRHPAKTGGAALDADGMRRAVRSFQEGLDIRRLGLSYVVEISYTAGDAERAAQLANAVAEAYIEDQLAARAQAARQGSQWLEERIEELRLQMNAAALKVHEFKARRDYRIVPKTEASSGAVGTDKQEPAPVRQNTLEELESTAQTFRRMYESFLQAYTESVQRQSYPVANARVITKATPPLRKSHPRTGLWLLLAMVCGAMVGLGIALIKNALSEARLGSPPPPPAPPPETRTRSSTTTTACHLR